MEVVNRTPYAYERVIIFDRDAAETLLVAVKASYEFAQGVTRLADAQQAVVIADEYHGEPGHSSLKLASEIQPVRKRTDITVTGHAIAPGPGVRQMEVGVGVGNIIQKAMVFGDRHGFGEVGRPHPFEKIPLIWENSFGGVDKTPDNASNHDYSRKNPVGRGFFANKSRMPADEVRLPNIEHPVERLTSPGDRPASIGFSPVCASWSPRIEHAGTYDDVWVRQRAPLLPDDFDEQFLQVAPAQLVAPGYLLGNEVCTIQGMLPEGVIRFPMLTMPPFIRVRFAKSGIRSTPNLESVHINADIRTVTLLWKSAMNVHGRIEELREIEIRLDQ